MHFQRAEFGHVLAFPFGAGSNGDCHESSELGGGGSNSGGGRCSGAEHNSTDDLGAAEPEAGDLVSLEDRKLALLKTAR